MLAKKTNKKLNLMSAVILTVGGLFLIQLVVAYNLATQGEKLHQLEVKKRQTEQANIILAEEISQAGSLSRITQEAEKLGMVRVSQVLNLTPQIPVALGTVNTSFDRSKLISGQ